MRKRHNCEAPRDESRHKVREGFLVKWDIDDAEARAVLAEACRNVLRMRET